MQKTAVFSPDRTYRYTLWRYWGGLWPAEYAMFIGLNPSTATEITDDSTVRRCINYAREWGYAGLCMTNIFAFRATDPAVMKAQAEPIGPENNYYLAEMAKNAAVVVAAWGTEGAHMNRGEAMRQLIPNLHCLGWTKSGHPKHPLYLRKDLKPIPWEKEGDLK